MDNGITDEMIVEQYPTAWKLAYRFQADGMSREDWTQWGIIGLLKGRKNYKVEKGIPWKHWAAAVIRKEMLSIYGETRRQKRYNGKPTTALEGMDRESAELSTEELAIAKEELGIMEEAIKLLNPDQYAIVSRRMAGKSYKTISRELGVGMRRVTERDYMATAWLREYLTARGVR